MEILLFFVSLIFVIIEIGFVIYLMKQFKNNPIQYSLFLILGIISLFVLLITIFRLPYKRYITPKKSNNYVNAVGAILTALLCVGIDFIFIIMEKYKDSSTIFLGVCILGFLFVFILLIILCVLMYKHNNCVYITKKNIIEVKIHWKNHKHKGLLFPRFRIVRGEIFPACFMDEKEMPISTPLCVVLENLKWKGLHHCTCTIQLVLDDVSDEKLFQSGNRFYLYHNYRKIAEGIIEK